MSLYTQYVTEHSKEEADALVKSDPCYFCYLQTNQFCKKMQGGGAQNPTFMIVSDYIHKGWLTTNKPFSGAMLPPLLNIIDKVGMKRDEIYWTSLVKCPTCKSLQRGKETAPKKEAVTYCSAYLEKELLEKKPKVIIACGQSALDFFFPKYKMAEKRCQVIWSEKYKCNVVPIYNPEALAVTYEFDDIIYKAFEQAYNAAYHPEKLVFPEVKYLLVKDINMLRQVAERVKKVERIAYDLETNSITYTKAKILSIGISWAKNTAVAWPLWVKDEDACSKMLEGLESREKTKKATQIDHNPPLKKFWKDDEWDEVIKLTKDIFENTTCKKGGHNTFFDNLVLHYNGIEVNNYTYDTMVMKHLLDEEREKSLDYCSWIYTDKGGYKMAKEVYLKSSESNYANIPLDVLLNYNAGDAAVTYELYDIFKPRIIAENLTYEMGAIRMPLQRALMEACIYGMRVDRKYLRETNKKLTQEMAEIEAKMLPTLQKYYGKDVNIVSGKDEGKMTGNDFNINSSDCLKDLLFNKMKLKSSGTTESGAPSTNESALLKLSRKGVEIADLILQRKKKFKFKTTYIDGMEDLLDENDRIHPSFNVCGTESGRLSSSSPNVQQIPRDKTIKKIFAAPDGYEIGECDFSQAELRVMAALSNDTTMKRIYEEDRDLHMELAVTAFHKPASEIDKEQRTVAKTCNFLIGYSGGPDTLKENLTDAGIEISKKEAERIIETWHNKFKAASSFLSQSNRRFIQTGLLETPFGRRRRFCRTFSDEYLNSKKGREGQNFIIQSTAAELAFISLINIAKEVKKYGGHVISTVHDSILIEYPVEQRDNIAKVCKQYTWVTYPFLNGLYMKSDFACAQSWGNKKEYDVDTGKFKED